MTDLNTHVSEAIWNAEFGDDPWPYLRVENVFPPDFYQNILENLPQAERMQPLSRKTQNRYLYWLVENGEVKHGVPEWWTLFRAALYMQLQSILEHKFDVRGSYIGSEIVYDFPGYSIRPHTDTKDKLITGIFYLPKDDGAGGSGTELYKRTGDTLETRYVSKYTPNSALFFQRTDTSYHGVPTTQVARWSLAYDIFK